MRRTILPAHPDKFAHWMTRIRERNYTVSVIDAHECQWALRAYYGSWPRVIWHLIRWALLFWWNDRYWHFVYLFCDWVGWTKLGPISGLSIGFQRHGKQCEGNCSLESDCIRQAIPNWYRKITGMNKHES